MKNSFLLLIFTCFFLFSCNTNENKEKDPELITGTWQLVNVESQLSGSSASFFIEQLLNKKIKEYVRPEGGITFSDDKTFTENIFFNKQGTYSVSTDGLLLKTTSKEFKFTLLTLNESTLKVSVDLTDEVAGLGINLSDYLSGDVSVSAVITCEKIEDTNL